MSELEKITKKHFLTNTQNQERYKRADEPEFTDEEKRISLLRVLGVSDENNSFENIKNVNGFSDTLKAFKDILGNAKQYMLLVYGGTGNGKSKCCEATVIFLFDKGIRCKRYRWSDVVRHLKELMKDGGYETYFNDFRSRNSLIIDDIGSGSTLGAWEWGELEDIIDYRLENKLFTILTTNLDIKEIPERIVSRFKDRTKTMLILDEAPDQRPLQGK